MLAAWYEKNGPAENVLNIGELEAPEPGPHDVRVKIHTSGVNPSDVKKRAGWRKTEPLVNPVTPHADGAGVVEAAGDGVSSSWLGRRVWIYNAHDRPAGGTAAKFIALPLRFVVPMPENVPFAIAACLGVPACTAHYAVFADGEVAEKKILVQGGAGAVGELAIQFAVWGGAEVIATISSEAKAAVATRAGASHTLNRHEVDVADAVRNIWADGVDRILELDFGANAEVDARVLKRGGIIVTYASSSSPTPSMPYYLLQSTPGLIRFLSVFQIDEFHRRRGLADINYALSRDILRPTIAAVFDFGDIAAAHEMVEGGKNIGNVVLRVAE